MWTPALAVKVLRQVVSVAGVQAEEYARHSLRIGGATHLSAGGADPEVLKREGRWALGAYKGGIRTVVTEETRSVYPERWQKVARVARRSLGKAVCGGKRSP